MTLAKPNPAVSDLEWSEEEWDAFFDADQTVIQLKIGQTITASDLEDIQLVVGHYRENDERATEAFDRGFQAGRDNAGGKDVGDLLRRVDSLRSEIGAQKLIRALDAAKAVSK